MDASKRVVNLSNETGRDSGAFEDWADQFRQNLKEKEADKEQHAVALEGKRSGRKFNRLFFFALVLAGALLVTLSLLKIV